MSDIRQICPSVALTVILALEKESLVPARVSLLPLLLIWEGVCAPCLAVSQQGANLLIKMPSPLGLLDGVLQVR